MLNQIKPKTVINRKILPGILLKNLDSFDFNWLFHISENPILIITYSCKDRRILWVLAAVIINITDNTDCMAVDNERTCTVTWLKRSWKVSNISILPIPLVRPHPAMTAFAPSNTVFEQGIFNGVKVVTGELRKISAMSLS